jgi:arabinofuranosyltransferase
VITQVALARRHLGVLLALACVAFSLAWLGDFATDDAAITLRYSRNWVDGHGIVWNAGEDPVEGYTNFLHVLLGAAAMQLGLPALGTLRLIGQASLCLLTLLVYALGLRALGSRVWATVAAMLVGIHPAFGYWASSGLETGLYALLVYGGVYASQNVRSARDLAPAVWFLLAALTRFEGPVLCGIALLPAALSALRERRVAPLLQHVGWLSLFVVTYGAYFAWRYAYFGHPLSNSAYWKIGAGSGFLLIREFGKHLVLPLALACLADYRRLGGFGLLLVTIIAAHVVGAYDMRNSVAYLHRFFLPAVPALALLAASGIARVHGVTRPVRFLRPVAGMLVALALVFEALHICGFRRARESADRLNLRAHNRTRVAAFLTNAIPASATVAVDDVGFIGYVVPQRVLDIFGLNSEAYVHVFGGRTHAYAKHLMSQHPAAIVLVSRRANGFRAHFPIGEKLHSLALRSRAYDEPSVFQSSRADGYHYFVLSRRGLAKLPPRIHRPFDARRSAAPAQVVDATFAKARAKR